MIHTIIIGIFAVILTYLNKYKNFRYGLECAFILITIFLAIRYDWGNDYNSYLDIFNSINSFKYNIFDFQAIKLNNDYELGWVILNLLFKPFGFFGLIIFLTVIEHIILYNFIKKYVPTQWQWFALFIYIFSANFMITGCSMIRQFFSICIYIYSIKFIINKKALPFTFYIILASFFHTSSLILAPTYFFSYINTNFKRLQYLIIIPLISFWFIFGKDIISEYFSSIIGLSIFEKYSIYIDTKYEYNGTGIGIIFNLFILILSFYKINLFSPKIRILVLLSILSMVFIPLLSFSSLIGRLGLYFSILSIAIIPNIFPSIKNNLLRYSLFLCYFIVTLKGFYDFFHSEVWRESFYNYKTIFSVSQWM